MEGESIYAKEGGFYSETYEGDRREREETVKSKPKEKRETKIQEIEAKILGLKIFASESYRVPKKSYL